MSSASEQKRRRLTIALGVASAVAFGGMYGVIAQGGATGTNAQAAVLTLDQSAYSALTMPDGTVSPVSSSDDESVDEASEEDGGKTASVAAAAPTPRPTHAPVVTPKPVTKTRGS